jgi:hypothetical protein
MTNDSRFSPGSHTSTWPKAGARARDRMRSNRKFRAARADAETARGLADQTVKQCADEQWGFIHAVTGTVRA